MNKDYKYCLSEKCIHRRGCRKNIGNYTDEEVKRLYTDNRIINEVDYSKCIPNYKDVNCTNKYDFLDRFRNSDGSSFTDNKDCVKWSIILARDTERLICSFVYIENAKQALTDYRKVGFDGFIFKIREVEK